jgi:hypothetical protein
MMLEADVIAKIRTKISELDKIGVVDLGHWAFDRIPCTRRQLYATVRKFAASWGYVYHPSEYILSGNRPFQKSHKRGQRRDPSLSRRK